MHPSAASQLTPAVSGAGLQGRLAQFLCLQHVLLPGTACVQLRQHLSTSFGCQATNTRHHASDSAEGREKHSHTSLSPVYVSNVAAPAKSCDYSSSEQGDRLADS